MSEFSIWFSTGAEHILNINAYDHLLFVTLLVMTFNFKEWKRLIILITAFTVGHSFSLALSALDKIKSPAPVIELLIALTILISALHAVVYYKGISATQLKTLYVTVVFFGLIHGLGFSYLLKAMLGKEESIFLPLLYFNLGLELGQLIIVLLVLGFSLLLVRLTKWSNASYKLLIACIITLVAAKITFERFLEFSS